MNDFTDKRFRELAGLLSESKKPVNEQHNSSRKSMATLKEVAGMIDHLKLCCETAKSKKTFPGGKEGLRELEEALATWINEYAVSSLEEKWNKDVEVKKTGEHAGQTVAQIRKRLSALKKKEDKSEAEKKEQDELVFALRAKTGWKKGKGATKESAFERFLDGIMQEKWGGDAEVHHTGEFEDRTVASLKKELNKIKAKEDKTEADKKREHQLMFAIRAKGGWKKGEGATK